MAYVGLFPDSSVQQTEAESRQLEGQIGDETLGSLSARMGRRVQEEGMEGWGAGEDSECHVSYVYGGPHSD